MNNGVGDLQMVVELLKEWAKWMQSYNPNIGYPSRVPMLTTGSGSSSFDDLLEQCENQSMKSIDASVESLPPSSRAAIMRCYGLCAVWRFPRASFTYEDALLQAHETLIKAFKRKGVM